MVLTRSQEGAVTSSRSAKATTSRSAASFLSDFPVLVLQLLSRSPRAKLWTVLTKDPHSFRPSQNRIMSCIVWKPTINSRRHY